MRFAALVIRLIVLALFWFLMAGVAHYAFIGINSLMSGTSGGGMMAMVIGVLVIAGLAFTERIMRLRVSFDDQQMRLGFDKHQSVASKTAPIEPEALRLRDMISLLDEDDLDDLRAEVRETLRERIYRLSADETETFEALLSDSKRKRR